MPKSTPGQNWRTESKALLNLGVPIIFAQMAYMGLGVIDTIMAGQLSAIDLGAIAIGRSIFTPVHIFVLGILIAVNPIVAQHFGAERHNEIATVVQSAIFVALLFSIPAILLVRNSQPVMTWMETDPRIIPVTVGYLNALAWSIPAAFIYIVLRFFNEGISISRPHLILMLLALPLNALANYALMYGRWGFPRMGAIGTGWATTAVWWLLMVAMIALVYRGRAYTPYPVLRQRFSIRWEAVKEILTIGFPNGISFSLEICLFAVVALLAGSMGANEIAGHQIAISVASFTFMIPVGLSLAASSRVGYFIGREEPENARLAGWTGIVLCAAVMCFTASLMFLFPEAIVGIYTRDPQVVDIALSLMLYAAIFQISDGLQVGAAGALRGMKDTRIPMLVNLSAYWFIGFGSGYYMGIVRGGGVSGLWTGFIFGLTFAGIAHTARFIYLNRLVDGKIDRGD